jgi:hypothetical protein
MSDRLTRLSEHRCRFDDIDSVYLLADGDARLLIDGRSQGSVSEALVTVVGPAGQLPAPATRGSP